MSGFAIYNYNFLRIIRPNEEYQLEFPDWVKVNVQESFENRQQLLEELLLTDFEKPFPFGEDIYYEEVGLLCLRLCL